MCGIVGVLANRTATPLIFDALKRLEYRGYDSAGIAVLNNGQMERRRSRGKLSELGTLIDQRPMLGNCGIGHTRWATHGAPSVRNAHPHRCGSVAVVHNGIIENHITLREQLARDNWAFESQTDTEVIATLCASMLRHGLDPVDAAAATISKLQGAYALCFLFEGADDLMICARQGSPLAIGHGENERFVGSDAIALSQLTKHITYLEEGDWAVLSRTGCEIHDRQGNLVERPVQTFSLEDFAADKGPFRHFMAKEIHEQPTALARALGELVGVQRSRIETACAGIDWSSVERLTVVACGTAYLAGHVGKIWIEKFARLPVDVEIASEFRYREPPLPSGGAMLVISQSGETADTLAALRYGNERAQKTISLVNVPTSTIARETELVLPTHAGPEIGVASTKAFTAQLLAILAVSIEMARSRGEIDDEEEARLVDQMTSIPRLLVETLALEPELKAIAADIQVAQSALFLGRGLMYPLALEGALKLKEVSYIHAEGYAAGELKHGPIALVDDAVPIIALAPNDALFAKTASNLREVMARNGRVILLSDHDGLSEFGEGAFRTIALPSTDPLLTPFVFSVAVQLIAYHTAVAKGTDVDQPRNLAKSVTVE